MTNTTVLKKSFRLTTKEMILVALMAAVTCILAPFSVPIPISPVPITLANLILFISIYVLGWRHALISLFLYLLLGLIGLPVFSGFSGGLAKLAGPTGGYLIGFIFMVAAAGILIERFPGNHPAAIAGMVLGCLITDAFGTVWLAHQAGLSFTAALAAGVIPYIAGDIAKIIVASIAGPILQKRLSRIQ